MASTPTSRQRFVGGLGHESDDETGLIYMRARYYDPLIGRFASEDPGREGSNWFVYCSDNPVNVVDPTGQAGIFDPGMVESLVYCLSKIGYDGLSSNEIAYLMRPKNLQVAKAILQQIWDDLNFGDKEMFDLEVDAEETAGGAAGERGNLEWEVGDRYDAEGSWAPANGFLLHAAFLSVTRETLEEMINLL